MNSKFMDQHLKQNQVYLEHMKSLQQVPAPVSSIPAPIPVVAAPPSQQDNTNAILLTKLMDVVLQTQQQQAEMQTKLVFCFIHYFLSF
jgi:hypothetical protein